MSRVLFVCIGNQGRSVMAERLFRRTAGDAHVTRSAGSRPGTATHPEVLEALGELGIDASEDRKSTRLNSSHIQKSRMPSSA